ncbi:BTAD domain-containing putative transcriptional regulator [Streptomyces sp. NPDC001930]|uniref:AfsR/SARP family transcriptional regulator n=1 Tax=Streptomyces sp. NPDC001930 TaxID=3364625 RepID=UPI0036AEF4E7
MLFAALLARCDQVITTDQLIREIWGDAPPRRATAALHVYVSQLRKFLKASGSGETRTQSPIVTRPLGYMLCIGSDEMDVNDFRSLMDEGRDLHHQGEYGEAVFVLEQALRIWRGAALADLQEGIITYAYANWLEETRLECTETLIEACLQLGRHREVVGRLYALTAQYPLRENFYRHLMQALYRADRQADALAVYQTARARLREELGLEPCRTLQQLNHDILAGDTRIGGDTRIAGAAA